MEGLFIILYNLAIDHANDARQTKLVKTIKIHFNHYYKTYSL